MVLGGIVMVLVALTLVLLEIGRGGGKKGVELWGEVIMLDPVKIEM